MERRKLGNSGPEVSPIGLGRMAMSGLYGPADRGEAIATILAACRQHGVTPGIHTGNGATARRYLDQGFLYLTVANELGLITIGGRAELEIARGTVAPADAAVI